MSTSWRILFLIAVVFLGSCRQIQQISDLFIEPTPRERYARNFTEDHTAFHEWKLAFESALRDSMIVELPFAEMGNFTHKAFPVYSFNALFQQGEKAAVLITSSSDSVPIFIDIYRVKKIIELQSEPLLSEKRFGKNPLEFPIQETGIYKIIIQPELHETVDFRMELYAHPSLAFPVAGVTDKAIQSFWGAPRSGGTRTHEGVDIFAPRLTPVLAVEEGRISFAGERGLGGKQVWLREGILNKSFYYAHLDSIKVSKSTKVQVGDTLGFVGNTGNARTTPPHLHFGIYTGVGAIDPLPFIRRLERTKIDLEIPSDRAFVATQSANLRLGPNSKMDILSTLSYRDTISIRGKTVNWYHVELADKTEGFIYHTLIREIDAVGSSDRISD